MHHALMRTHRDIIKQAGAESVRAIIGDYVSIHTVRSWQQRDAIPGEYWATLAAHKVAPLRELAEAADRRRKPANDTQSQSVAA